MEKSMRESQEKILGALMASQERHDQQMLEVMAVLSQRGVASGGPETLLQSSAALPRKPLKSTKVDNDTFFQDHFAPEEGTGMMGSDAQLFSTIEKRQNRPPRSTLEPPAMNVNRERDVSWGKPATHLGGGWAPHSTTDLHDWRLTQPVQRSAAPTMQSHPSAANPRLPKFTGKVGDPLDWVAFIVNFERRAERYTWDDATRLDFLIECLQDQAAHFFSRLPSHHRCSYALLKEKLRTRFNVVQAPAVPRKQLQDVRQGMEESLQEFASRVQQLARDAHPSLVTEAVEPMAVDAFLRGCKEKLAAYSALNREPATVELAVNLVEGAVTNQQAVFGSTVPVSKLRQVLRFENPTQTQPDDYQVRAVHASSVEGLEAATERRCGVPTSEVSFSVSLSVGRKLLFSRTGSTSFMRGKIVVGIKSATRGATTGHDKSATTGRRQENGRRRMKTAVEASSNPCDSSHILQVRQLLPLVWSPNLGGVFFSFPLCWSEASVLQDGVNVLYEGEDCGGKQVRDPWRHHRPRQERHHWTETRKQQTTNEDRSGSIKQPLRLVSYFTSPSTPPIGLVQLQKQIGN
ncbi:hypothetical protein CAPTEDRAFT_199198 [Capitella teleta]|uniref:Retrotransposon gag domain-containing protein n=1 Tax=Capitella teleta TaxID=283909 RepID=R7V0Z4_CAPTE|nr:hypothetical protein CAPTEDRAFT_199198 [Capitella teleta]|eukprot:ELU12523.1 hypothetical protein CAPTEDRAFT_199198 [Capitella teleta]